MHIDRLRGALRSACAMLAIATLGAAEAPEPALCGNPIASGVQRGSFQKIALGSQCDVKTSSGPAVSLSVGNVAPIFWIGQLVDGECRMTLGTIENDAFVAITQTNADVGDQPPVDAGEGTYWSTSSSHAAYVRLDAKTHEDSVVELVTPGARVRSLASDVSGRAYSIEIAMTGQRGARLVDLQARTAHALPPATYTKALTRGGDGKLYFQQYSTRQPMRAPCELFAVDAAGRGVETTTCDLTGDSTVGPSGTMWDSTELGVVLRDPSTQAQTLYAPVYAPPCNNFTPSSSYAHHIVADPRGNAWFVLGKLWHVDRRGIVTSIEIPERAQQDAATRGLFETADGSLWLFSKKYVEHFVP